MGLFSFDSPRTPNIDLKRMIKVLSTLFPYNHQAMKSRYTLLSLLVAQDGADEAFLLLKHNGTVSV